MNRRARKDKLVNVMNYFSLSFADILDEAEAIAGDATRLFGGLKPQQINWKPSDRQWSVGECLEHVIQTNRAFLPQFEEILHGRKETTLWQRVPIVPALFGSTMIRALSPESTRKVHAPKRALPGVSALDPHVVARFVEHQREMIRTMNSMQKYNLAGIIITSPFAGVVTYSVLDSFRIIVAHERRHFGQAQRVMSTSGFPN